MSGSTSGNRVGDILAEIVAGTASTGQAFFESLVLCLSRALGVRYALVGERVQGGAIRTLGLCADGALQPAIEYRLAGTPCANVMTGTPCYYASQVAELFPQDALLRDMGATSYLGVPLRSSTSAPLGILVVLHDAPIEPDVDPQVILQVFAGRAAAEIERLQDERELVRRADQLRRSEEMFSKVFRSNPAAMTISDMETGLIVDVNDAFTRSRGLAREDVVGRSSMDAGLWDRAEDRAAFLERFARDGSVRDLLLDVPGPGGRRLLLRVAGEVAQIAGRRYLITMSENVTDRFQAELALKRSAERLLLALDAAHMGAWDWDLVTQGVGWTDRENAVCGFPEGTRITHPEEYLERVHPDDRPRLQGAIEAALAGETPSGALEHRLRQADGVTYHWVESRAMIGRDAAGRAVRVAGTIADIDERKQTEAELEASQRRLRRSEEMFSKVFRSSPAPMAIARTGERGVVDVNDAMVEATGVSRSEILGSSAVALGLWTRAQRDAIVGEITRAGRVRNAPVELRTPRGPRTMLLSGELVEIADEPHFLVMTVDVTERLEAERRLQQSEERWRRFSEATFEGIGIAEAGRLIDANTQLAVLLGYDSVSDLVGRPTMELIAPESMDEVRARIAADFSEPYEHIALKRDGTRVPVEVRGRSFEAAGRRIRVTAVRDMTERRRFESELREAAREWNECFDAMPAGLVIADETGVVRRANRLVLEWSGRAHYRDLVGHAIESLGPEEPWCGLMRLASAPSRDGTSEELAAASGQVWRVAWSTLPRAEEERPWVIFAIRDVTEERRLRDDLRRQETLAAMGSLVAGVAHEVRTPLFSISATIDAFESGEPGEVEEGTRLLRAQVKRLSALMSDLLDYGRPPALNLQRGGLVAVVERAVRTCEDLARHAGVAIRVERPREEPHLQRDERRLEQAFQNLLANAIQHSPAGAAVCVTLSASPEGSHVVLRFEDEGAGIPEAHLPTLFEPFFTKRKGGTGLGLPIVQRIVETHGGRVAAANRPQGGAVFIVTLPLSGGAR